MISTFTWLAAAAFLFWWNATQTPFIGVRFTERLFGAPLGGQWLCLALAFYCAVRYFARRGREGKG